MSDKKPTEPSADQRSGVPKIWARPDGDSFHRAFPTEIEDFFATYYGRETPLPFSRYVAWPVAAALFAALIFAYPYYQEANWTWVAIILGGGLFAGLAFAWLTHGFAKGFARGFWIGAAEKQDGLGDIVDMTLDQSGLAVVCNGQSFYAPWSAVDAVEETDQRFFFWVNRRFAYVLPKNLFDETELPALSRNLAAWWGRAPTSPPMRAGHYIPGYSGFESAPKEPRA